jgi:hypothetical protein
MLLMMKDKLQVYHYRLWKISRVWADISNAQLMAALGFLKIRLRLFFWRN